MKKNTMPAPSELTVGYDAKRAVMNNTGLGNYSRYVVNIMSAAYPSAHFRLYSPRLVENERLAPLLARANVELCGPSLKPDFGLRRAWWRTVDLPLDLRRDDVTLYHGLSNELPLTIGGVCPSVVTIHDLIWRRVPADYSAIDRRIYDFKYGRSARLATRVVAISECTRRDLVADFGIDPAKIDVIYQGVDPLFSIEVDSAARARVREKYKLPERYIAAVGTVEGRKNQMLALRAMERLPKSVGLVILGRFRGDYGRRVERYIASTPGLAGRVLHLQGVPLADIPAIYSAAAFSSYTSRYEGFGLPIVESLTAGCPVVAATGSCLEEAGGGGALYVAPDDVDAYVEAAMTLLDDRYRHDRLAEAGRRHVRRFSAENFARATMACYNKAIIDFALS